MFLAACVACGNFVSCFPAECESSLPVLLPLFFGNLQDPIASVRQGAALALSQVVKSYETNITQEIFNKISEGFTNIKNQSPDSTTTSIGEGRAVFGVVKGTKEYELLQHTDQQVGQSRYFIHFFKLNLSLKYHFLNYKY